MLADHLESNRSLLRSICLDKLIQFLCLSHLMPLLFRIRLVMAREMLSLQHHRLLLLVGSLVTLLQLLPPQHYSGLSVL